MVLSAAETDSIGQRTGSRSSRERTDRLRRMLANLENVAPGRTQGNALKQLCQVGVSYGWSELKRTVPSSVLQRTVAKAQADLREYLSSQLEWITRPCFELERTSLFLALEALGFAGAGATRKRFSGNPNERLPSLFKKFPVLAGLWSLSINQWQDFAEEILTRTAADDRAIGRAFLKSNSGGKIKRLRLGLSDRHNGGRTVARVEFECGRVIYKPRDGRSEGAWGSVLRLMNEHGFEPALKPASVLYRGCYHWMEYVAPAPCNSAGAVRRFYKRLGGLIAAAHLLNAVDCHRDNLIAAGEHPILIDTDALWHVSTRTKTQTAIDLLFRTGFFPNANPDSLQSRSSALGQAATGSHRARIGARAKGAAHYADQIIAGFRAGWTCLLGTPRRRAAFFRRVRRIRSQERRWIYLATEKYAAILRSSVQPEALISGAARAGIIRRSCARTSVGGTTVEAEIKALERLDVPYFIRRTTERMPPVPDSPPPELLEAIRKALEWTR